jgi:uncharacterized membrane protein
MSRQYVHRLFAASVLIKGVDGVLETIGGILFMFVSPKALNSVVAFLTAHELSEDPDDWFTTTLRHVVHNLSSDTKLFVSAYLVAHGFIKCFSSRSPTQETLGISRGALVSRYFHSLPAVSLYPYTFPRPLSTERF